ncbi:hypothetical protein [Caldisericum exile]|uniref:Uncharacterized protein n=1 Tax=Caldisericum exile (strain DSM 21853 / NBRC 104410 / AZM16c01) TaxID=511051 RepID=A0A7U6GD83_CALEA|nr:hypothetical protein [Caldisericum exile]BAL80185.1 hypothetical protein CSE_00590 [Caldisericum exile AZM16c01]
MRNKNNKEIEKMEKMLKSVKPPELIDEEIERYKNEFEQYLQGEFDNVARERERSHHLRVRLAYGIGIFVLLLFILSFVYTKPYFVKLATAKIIENKLQYKVALKDIIVKDGVGIVIYNYKEVTVNVLSGNIEVSKPIEYEPSNEEKEKAIEIVRNSKEAKYFVASEGASPQDISKNEVVSIKGLMFPNSGKKLIEVLLAYTPQNFHPDSQPGLYPPLMTAKFIVDIEKGKIQP